MSCWLGSKVDSVFDEGQEVLSDSFEVSRMHFR